MAEFIKSVYRITWDPAGSPLVLVDIGDRMLTEPAIGQVHSSELVPFARALYMVGFHFDNVGHSVAISRIAEDDTVAASRNGMLSHLATTATRRTEDVKIEVENGDVFYLRDCVFQDVTPQTGPELGTAHHRVGWSYQIMGGKLEVGV